VKHPVDWCKGIVLLASLAVGTAWGSERTPWTTSRIAGSPEPPPLCRVERVFPRLGFQDGLDFAYEPTGQRWWVLQLNGRLLSFPNDPAATHADLAIDVSKIRQPFMNALGFTLHPGFATNRFVFVVYVGPDKAPEGSRLSRFRVDDSQPPKIDPASEKVFLTWRGGGHNGSSLKFGPDGFLYVSTGDGEGPEPPDLLNTGQNLDDLLSVVVRIDVDREEAGRPYAIPAGNPFVNRPGARGEIWAYGFRNPWRTSFGPDGALWVGDVGWELWEMIHRVTAGYNAGWAHLEGPQIVKTEQRPPTPIGRPVAIHPHSEAASITGGFFYDGPSMSWLRGHYVYGDFETGRLWALHHENGRPSAPRDLADTPLKIIGFAPAPDGELLMLDYRPEGGLYRLAANPPSAATAAFPRRLRDTGLFSDVAARKPAPGVEPYSINAGMWSDGAQVQRWLAIPGTNRIVTRSAPSAGDRRWDFPSNSVLVRTLSLERTVGQPESARPIETQILHQDGTAWQAYTFRWNEAGTDADLVPAAGTNASISLRDDADPDGSRSVTWRWASRTECLRCHNPWSGPPLAFNFDQLPGGTNSGELGRLIAGGWITSATGGAEVPRVVDPHATGVPLEARARSWLHVNCAHCHRWGAGGAVAAYFDLDRPLQDSRLLDVKPARGDFGMLAPRLIAPGEPWRSAVNYRISTEGSGHMPAIGARGIDERGVRLVRDWIRSLEPAPAADPATTAAREWMTKNGDRAQVPTPAFLETTSGALASLDAGGRPSPGTVELAARSANVPTRDLFAHYLPPGRRRQTLGEGFDPGAVLALEGSAERGRAVFRAESGPNCIRCHALEGQGREFGPSLAAAVKPLSAVDLLDHIVHPSKRIAPEFVTRQIETRDGLTRSGFITAQSPAEVTLWCEDGARAVIRRADIVTESATDVSAMPEGLLANLTAQEAADLLAYLRAQAAR
jgi:putative heme-binding domain-containing protein